MAPVEALLITGVHWVDDHAHVRVRQPVTAASELRSLVGLSLNYRLSAVASRHCIGHKPWRQPDVEWFDCPNVPLRDGRKCDRCAAADATYASQLHHAHTKARGELEGTILRQLEKPNRLYLAAFRDGSLKVGTSNAARLNTRLAEQGVWMARIVADTTDGFAVRSIEDRVTVELGLPQSVSIKRKIDGLAAPRDDQSLEREIELWTTRVHELIARAGDARVTATNESWRFAQAADDVWTHLHPYPLKLRSGSHDIEFVAASGRSGVLRRPGSSDLFVADVQQLFGIEITPGDHVPDELSVQDSLF